VYVSISIETMADEGDKEHETMYARYCKRRNLGLLVAAQRYDDMEVVCCTV
jgi:hypothetical protein